MIEFSAVGRVGNLLINRPESRNAFTAAMVRQFGDVLRQARDAVDILVIRGEGPDFSVGRDRKELRPAGGPFEAFRALSEVNELLAGFPGVVVVAVQGTVHGFGVGIVMRCDIALGAQDAHFGFDEVALGFPPMFVMQEILRYVPHKRAMDVLLSGREFSAEEAHQIGLLSRAVPSRDLDAETSALIELLSKQDGEVMASCKRYLREVVQMSPEARSAYALAEQTRFALRAVDRNRPV